jgi:hypothetical protein
VRIHDSESAGTIKDNFWPPPEWREHEWTLIGANRCDEERLAFPGNQRSELWIPAEHCDREVSELMAVGHSEFRHKFWNPAARKFIEKAAYFNAYLQINLFDPGASLPLKPGEER